MHIHIRIYIYVYVYMYMYVENCLPAPRPAPVDRLILMIIKACMRMHDLIIIMISIINYKHTSIDIDVDRYHGLLRDSTSAVIKQRLTTRWASAAAGPVGTAQRPPP